MPAKVKPAKVKAVYDAGPNVADRYLVITTSSVSKTRQSAISLVGPGGVLK